MQRNVAKRRRVNHRCDKSPINRAAFDTASAISQPPECINSLRSWSFEKPAAEIGSKYFICSSQGKPVEWMLKSDKSARNLIVYPGIPCLARKSSFSASDCLPLSASVNYLAERLWWEQHFASPKARNNVFEPPMCGIVPSTRVWQFFAHQPQHHSTGYFCVCLHFTLPSPSTIWANISLRTSTAILPINRGSGTPGAKSVAKC